jgi:hypothetical protein
MADQLQLGRIIIFSTNKNHTPSEVNRNCHTFGAFRLELISRPQETINAAFKK